MKKIMHSRVFDFHGCRDSVPENEEGKDFNSGFEKNSLSILFGTEKSNFLSRSVSSFILLFMLFLFPNVSNAQTITVDGNPEDWDYENFVFFPVRSYVLDAFGTGQVDNQFTSSKDFFLADGTTNNHLTWVIGQTKAKNDIANAAAVLSNGVLYFAGDRTSNEGDAQIGFWFFLNGTAPRVLQTSPNTGGDFAPEHAVGDLLILADFTNGGTNATVSIFRWVGSGGNVPNTDGRLNTTNLTGTVAINNNAAYSIPDGWTFINPTYDTNEFYEGQVDLTSLNLTNTCFSSFLLEARASQSITASLDDFAGASFNVVPEVFINDVTVCSGESALFTAVVNGGIEPITYSFNGGPFTSNNTFTINPATSSTTVTVVAKGDGPNFCESDPAVGNLTVTATPEANAGPDKVLTCTTTSIALSGSSTVEGALFSWVASNGGNIVSGADTATPTVNSAGTYTLTVTSPIANCSDTDVALVTLDNTPPNANAGADKVLTCTTTSIALSGSSSTPGATFSWLASNGGNIVSGANTATPTVNAAGTYTLTVTNPANGCTATDIALVTLNNTPPNVNAGADKVLTCTTTSIALSGSSSTPGVTFAWVASNGGNIVSGANTATPTVNAAGTYTLTVTNPANGCTATDVALVTLDNTPPNVNAGADKVLTCTTTSIGLSGSSSTPGATFAWVASNGGNIVSGANTATPTVNAAGTYTLTVTNPANGCTATDIALVTLNGTPPNADAGADKVLTCTTTSIALSGSSSTPGATFAWVASNGGNIVSGANTATPTVNAAGTYTLTVTNPANGCTVTDIALVTLNNTPPNVNAGADKVLTCTTTSIALSGSSSTPGATFAWVASNGGNIVSGANTATPTVNAAGTYTLTVTNPANGCTATDIALVTLNNTPPNVNAGADKVLTCTTTSIALSGSSSTPGATFAWVASNGGNIVSGANTATPTVNAAGTYTLTVTNPANGCTATDIALVTLNNTPPNVNAGADKVLTCTTTSIALSGSSSTPGATFAWVASNGGNIVSGANTATPTVNAAGTYTLTVTNPANGCTATDVALVTLDNTPPNANAGADKELTCIISSIALSGSSSTPGATFSWVASNGGNIVSGANTANPTVDAVGTYTLTVTNPANGCTATDVALVTLNNTPPDVAAGEDANVPCGSTSTVLSGSSSTPGATFAWVASNGGSIISGADTATPTVSGAGTYTLTVTNPANGCTASDAVDVTVSSCRVFCTYTMGYYGNRGGTACTPDGPSTTANLILNSILNMPNEIMYLGRGTSAADLGGSFTATPADVDKIISIMPGGGGAASISGDYTPYTVQPLQNGKIRNVLLSQTIALALNLYMPSDLSESVGNFSLEGSGGKYLVTAARAEGSSCEEPVQADCLLQPTAIQSSSSPIPANVIAALPANPKVWDLFQLAKNALGGLLPAGVSHSNINDAVNAINVGFDKCRFFVEFADAPQACPIPEVIIAKTAASKEIFDVEVYPVPFKDNLTLTYRFASTSPVTIAIYDIRGALLYSQIDLEVNVNKEVAIPLNFATMKTQMYFIKIFTDKGTIVKKVISE